MPLLAPERRRIYRLSGNGAGEGNRGILDETLLENGCRISSFPSDKPAGELSSRFVCLAFAAPALVCDGVQMSHAELDHVPTASGLNCDAPGCGEVRLWSHHAYFR